MAAAIALAFSCTKPDDGPAGGNGTLVIDADRFEIVADGKDADLVVLDEANEVADVFVGGRKLLKDY